MMQFKFFAVVLFLFASGCLFGFSRALDPVLTEPLFPVYYDRANKAVIDNPYEQITTVSPIPVSLNGTDLLECTQYNFTMVDISTGAQIGSTHVTFPSILTDTYVAWPALIGDFTFPKSRGVVLKVICVYNGGTSHTDPILAVILNQPVDVQPVSGPIKFLVSSNAPASVNVNFLQRHGVSAKATGCPKQLIAGLNFVTCTIALNIIGPVVIEINGVTGNAFDLVPVIELCDASSSECRLGDEDSFVIRSYGSGVGTTKFHLFMDSIYNGYLATVDALNVSNNVNFTIATPTQYKCGFLYAVRQFSFVANTTTYYFLSKVKLIRILDPVLSAGLIPHSIKNPKIVQVYGKRLSCITRAQVKITDGTPYECSPDTLFIDEVTNTQQRFTCFLNSTADSVVVPQLITMTVSNTTESFGPILEDAPVGYFAAQIDHVAQDITFSAAKALTKLEFDYFGAGTPDAYPDNEFVTCINPGYITYNENPDIRFKYSCDITPANAFKRAGDFKLGFKVGGFPPVLSSFYRIAPEVQISNQSYPIQTNPPTIDITILGIPENYTTTEVRFTNLGVQCSPLFEPPVAHCTLTNWASEPGELKAEAKVDEIVSNPARVAYILPHVEENLTPISAGIGSVQILTLDDLPTTGYNVQLIGDATCNYDTSTSLCTFTSPPKVAGPLNATVSTYDGAKTESIIVAVILPYVTPNGNYTFDRTNWPIIIPFGGIAFLNDPIVSLSLGMTCYNSSNSLSSAPEHNHIDCFTRGEKPMHSGKLYAKVTASGLFTSEWSAIAKVAPLVNATPSQSIISGQTVLYIKGSGLSSDPNFVTKPTKIQFALPFQSLSCSQVEQFDGTILRCRLSSPIPTGNIGSTISAYVSIDAVSGNQAVIGTIVAETEITCDINAKPSPEFTECINGEWSAPTDVAFNGTVTVTDPVRVDGNLTLSADGTLTLGGLGATITAKCIHLGGELVVNLSKEELEEIKKSNTKIIITSDGECITGEFSGKNVNLPPNTCEQVSYETTTDSTSLTAVFNVQNNGCSGVLGTSLPDWAIGIIVGAIAVLLIVALTTILAVPKIRNKVLPFRARATEAARRQTAL